ncbi:MAG: hypothetical protein OEZ02_07105 [Anaerolineae bacterium]|nr:hypothetical protein [Anaerolineae bacterium]
MKNVVCLQNYNSPTELEAAIADFLAYSNLERYHESLDNLTPADINYVRRKEGLIRREEIKRKTLRGRRRVHIERQFRI